MSNQFDKYKYYRRAVQSPEADVEFLRDTYKELRKKSPRIMREDFCGTFAISCEWVKLHRDYIAHGVDLDPEPIEFGTKNYQPKLSSSQRARLNIHLSDVLNPELPAVDIICALNFSYFIFKTRPLLKRYFENCLRTLKKDGIFVVDCFGGGRCLSANEDRNKRRGFTYYWEQLNFNPINHFAEFQIHFKPDGGRKIKNVFSYDWRMWSLPELQDLMLEVGFSRAQPYWEGTSRSGGGNGIFAPTDKGEEDCESWIAYIVGMR